MRMQREGGEEEEKEEGEYVPFFEVVGEEAAGEYNKLSNFAPLIGLQMVSSEDNNNSNNNNNNNNNNDNNNNNNNNNNNKTTTTTTTTTTNQKLIKCISLLVD